VYNNSIKATEYNIERSFTMAIIPQQRIFMWDEIKKLGDLERLR